MATYEITYEGYQTLDDVDVDRGDKVKVMNQSDVPVLIYWPSCFDPAPLSSVEEVAPQAESGAYMIGQGASSGADYPVKIEPIPRKDLHVIDLPETAVPNIHILG